METNHKAKSSNYDDRGIPQLYDVFQGEVASVQTYGAFVKIPGSHNQGLVHVSQLSRTRVENATDVVSQGEKIYCKVINIDKEGDKTKIGLSMKLVNQTTGKDTDPNNVELSLDQNRKKSGSKQDFQKIKLGVFLDTTCKKCGGKGHLTQDCFSSKDGKKYDLIPEIDEDSLDTNFASKTDGTQSSQSTYKDHVKKKKLKKDKSEEKRQKKKKRRKDSASSSDSDSSPTHKKKRHKTQKKKHRHRSDHS